MPRQMLPERGERNPFQTKTEEELAALRFEIEAKMEAMNQRLASLEANAIPANSLTKRYDDFILKRDGEYNQWTVYGKNGERLEGLSDVKWMTVNDARQAYTRYMETGKA